MLEGDVLFRRAGSPGSTSGGTPEATQLHDQLTATTVDEKWLAEIEARDNLFPDVDWNFYWR
ncbi:MAG TPA: 1,4-alpha-glucan branching protein domain-containing protein [Candidatus Solibacter sp.]|nr:1,4-alpha-glucan branching protein domain-containing protein [Candidatus Solibacter sp.]